MTENGNTRPARRSPGWRPYSPWWLLAKDGELLAEVCTMECDGRRVLPAFSGEGEAQMFLRLRDSFVDSWYVRRTSAGELASLLSGPCAGVESVALDPSPGMTEVGTMDLVSMDRKKFVGWVIALGCVKPAPGSRRTRGFPPSGIPGVSHSSRRLS